MIATLLLLSALGAPLGSCTSTAAGAVTLPAARLGVLRCEAARASAYERIAVDAIAEAGLQAAARREAASKLQTCEELRVRPRTEALAGAGAPSVAEPPSPWWVPWAIGGLGALAVAGASVSLVCLTSGCGP